MSGAGKEALLAGRPYSARQCPRCEGDATVAKTRVDGKGYLRRYRTCLQCGWDYVTVELELTRQGGSGRTLRGRELAVILGRAETNGKGESEP